MTTHLMATSTIALGKLATLTAIASALVAAPAWAQHYPVTTAQKQTANVVAQLSLIHISEPTRPY